MSNPVATPTKEQGSDVVKLVRRNIEDPFTKTCRETK